MSKLSFLDLESYPRVTQRLSLSQYNPDFKDDYLEIWLNWSAEFNDQVAAADVQLRRAQMMMNENVRRILDKASEALGKTDAALLRMLIGEDEDRKKAINEALEEVWRNCAMFWGCEYEDVAKSQDLDMDLWEWIMDRSTTMRREYKEGLKKTD